MAPLSGSNSEIGRDNASSVGAFYAAQRIQSTAKPIAKQKGSACIAISHSSEMFAPTEKRFVVLQEDEGLSVALVILIYRQCIDAGADSRSLICSHGRYGLVAILSRSVVNDLRVGDVRIFQGARHQSSPPFYGELFADEDSVYQFLFYSKRDFTAFKLPSVNEAYKL
ncbi:hypothetical protein [Pseudomonas laurylsulfativorans]|uniref:hypothetical protein n=1 Tax=Pseudomonas laurylsulfativorans TaxID=1943631 RepID=UPI0010570F17|nr:hypothetical protein [Pseudomonas laurylsulfativorans]